MQSVDPHEFAGVMARVLFQAAKTASGSRDSRAIHKDHENVPGTQSEVDRASRVDVLSEIDLAIQEMILAVVREHWPYVSVLAEEDTPTKASFTASSDYCVLIDPVDGTKNFLQGDRRFCHIVSLMEAGEMLASLLYSHSAESLYVAIRGCGLAVTTAAGGRLPVRLPRTFPKTFFHHVSRIPDAVVRELEGAGFRPVISTQNASDILALLKGESCGFISRLPLVYDVWSPGMIVQEAGGWISNWQGRPLKFDGTPRLPNVLIATSADIAAPMIECLSKYC